MTLDCVIKYSLNIGVSFLSRPSNTVNLNNENLKKWKNFKCSFRANAVECP